MIYYPLSVLMLANIRDILIITTPESLPQFQSLLGDGKELGLNLTFITQDEPRGLSDAFIVGEDFIDGDSVVMILGDNIFFGDRLYELLNDAKKNNSATVFGYYVRNPQDFGVIEFNSKKEIVSIEEKPSAPKSNWVLTGLYYFDKDVVQAAKGVRPSKRGELEITDTIKWYLERGRLDLKFMGRGYAWLDTGNYSSLIDAAIFIKAIEERQGLKIGCIEEVAYRMGYISQDQLKELAGRINTNYGEYLRKVAMEGLWHNE